MGARGRLLLLKQTCAEVYKPGQDPEPQGVRSAQQTRSKDRWASATNGGATPSFKLL